MEKKVKLEEAVNMVMDGRIKANSAAHLILKVYMVGVDEYDQ